MSRALGILVFAGALGAFGCDGTTAEGVPAPLATGQPGITGIAVDDNFVYWTLRSGAVRRVSLDGGAVETVVEGLTLPNHIAVDGTHVYWTTLTGEISRASKTGGTAVTVAEGETEGVNTIVGFQVDSTHVYWNRNRMQDDVVQADLRSQPKDGGAQVVLTANPTKSFLSLSLAQSTLFWNAGGSEVREISIEGESERSLVGGLDALSSVTTNGKHMCWTSSLSGARSITRAALDGSDVRVLASEREDTGGGCTNADCKPATSTIAATRILRDIDAFIADEATIYYSTLDGRVASLPIDGGVPYAFATGPDGKTSMALDQAAIYWAHENGDAIFTLPKF